MTVPPEETRAEFPHVGFRARRWQRFERDLQAWLATPEGRFARWRARRQVQSTEPVSAGSRRRGP
jgi:hypothetical protein